MNFLQKLKKDKKFRTKVMLVFVAVVLIAGNYEEPKKEAKTYEQCHAIMGAVPSATDYRVCDSTSGCYVRTFTAGNWLLGTDDILACLDKIWQTAGTMVDCTNAAADGQYIVADVPNVGCSSQLSVKAGSLCGTDIYRCVSTSAEDRCDSELQSTIANLGSQIPWVQDMSCPNRFYFMAFGGGFLGLILILAVI